MSAVAARNVLAEAGEALTRGRRIGQQEYALAHHRAAERFQRAQDAHSCRRVFGRQVGDVGEPVRGGRGLGAFRGHRYRPGRGRAASRRLDA